MAIEKKTAAAACNLGHANAILAVSRGRATRGAAPWIGPGIRTRPGSFACPSGARPSSGASPLAQLGRAGPACRERLATDPDGDVSGRTDGWGRRKEGKLRGREKKIDASGHVVSNYCRERLHVVLSKELRRPPSDLGEMSDVDMKEHWDDLFTRCFQTVDDEVSGLASRLVDGEPRSDPIAAENVGSTAVAVVVCSSHVAVANCGDSRIVLSRGKEPVALSIDQKPDRKDERARIEAAGGKVIQWNGHRVSGILAMSRSIGDRYLKPYIIPKPEVTVVPRAKDDDCLILASDGLWDVVSNEEACKVARRQIQQWHKNNSVTTSSSDGGDGSTDPAAQAAADYLTRLALKKGSQDNITVIVVDLKPRRKPKNNS
ncbi:putative protein phosphatase 2C 50 [Triticum urartu]|uniref:protein-serine/threonine phosphatase n=1 Tax=Triticum urartu TaxID=4572 RepID=M8A5V0_TRIUA|nr:putative protein phosphatase 2C 50 [Triticum urartu]